MAETGFREKTAKMLRAMGYSRSDIDAVKDNIHREDCFETLIDKPPSGYPGDNGSYCPSLTAEHTGQSLSIVIVISLPRAELSGYTYDNTTLNQRSMMSQNSAAGKTACTDVAVPSGLLPPSDSPDARMQQLR